MRYKKISDVFRDADPGHEALVTRSGRWTYRQLDDACDRAAGALWSMGVRPGARVGVSLPNDVEVVLAFHGLMRVGAVWVGVNRNLAEPEKQHLLRDSGATTYLDDEDAWRDAVRDATPVELPDVDPDALAGIAYTSGTTGRPKGAMHSQRTLLTPGAALVASRGYGADLRKGDCFPLTILNLQVLTTLLTAQAGGCAVVMDRIDAEGVAEWIRRERVTTWNGPPALLHSLVERDDITRDDLSSLDEVWTGGADCPEPLRERFAAKFGHQVHATYGLTEAPTVVAIDPRGGEHRAGASGRPLPHLAVTVVDGELCVGPVDDGPWAGVYHPMLGYLDRPEATAEVLAGGVLHTGDLGELDADGFLHVRDRKSLVIIRGGANVYPAEVERVLSEAAGVAGCAVFGVADERLGERVMAVVEPLPDAALDGEALRAHCLEQLAKYKVPERIAVVDALPRNAMGKVERPALGALL
ncbi:MAG: AMP-dependent synthetase and ligase [Actinomycetia bacterium]|nr:AMP-dependent synthetase and ligase [Actinomycetes bacterium]